MPENALESMGFAASFVGASLFVLLEAKKIVIIVANVEDLLIISSSDNLIESFFTSFKKRCEVKEQKEFLKFLGMNVHENGHLLKLDHKDMITRLLKTFNMENCHSLSCPIQPSANIYSEKTSELHSDVTSYHQLIGSLLC